MDEKEKLAKLVGELVRLTLEDQLYWEIVYIDDSIKIYKTIFNDKNVEVNFYWKTLVIAKGFPGECSWREVEGLGRLAAAMEQQNRQHRHKVLDSILENV